MLRWLVLGVVAGCVAPDDDASPDAPDPVDGPDDLADTPGLPRADDVALGRRPAEALGARSRDSDPPVPDDTAPPTPPLPPFTGGLVELAAARWAERPFPVDPGDVTTGAAPQRTTAWLGDLDGDGVAEVVTGTTMWGVPGAPRHVRVLRWTPSGLADDDALTAALGTTRHPPLAAVDLDRDGLVDLVSGDVAEAVRWGEAPGVWGPPVDLLGGDGETTQGYALGLFDLDRDGWLDLLFGDAAVCRRVGWAALRTGPRSFAVDDTLLSGPRTNSIAFLAATLRDGGTFLYVVDDSHCYDDDGVPHAFRQIGWRDDRVPLLQPYDPAPADAFWKLLPAYAGRSVDALTPMGAGLDDLDGDGNLDLVITTGLPTQVVLAGHGDGTFRDGSGGILAPDALGWVKFRWGLGFPDLDLDGRGDVVWSVGDDEGSFLAQRGEPMRPAVSWNAGGLRFVDAEDAVGVTQVGSWRALGLGDPDHDGDADVVVGGHGFAPLVYRNDVDVGGRRGLSLRLVGTTSNVLGVGARVEEVLDGAVVRTAVVGATGNPLSVGEPLVFLGAGDRGHVDEVVIHWPSGLVQHLHDVAVGQLLNVTEPPTIEVLDDDRAAPADHFSEVTLRFVPRDATGAPDRRVRVTATIGGAPAEVAFPPASDGYGTWVMRVRAPAQPGTSWITVRFDGVELPIAPKLRWTPP